MPSTPTEVPEAHVPNSASNSLEQANVNEHENSGFQIDKKEKHLSLNKDIWNGDTSDKSNDSGGFQAEASSAHLNYTSNATIVMGNGAQELTAVLEPSEMLIRAPDSVQNSLKLASEDAKTEQPVLTLNKPEAELEVREQLQSKDIEREAKSLQTATSDQAEKCSQEVTFDQAEKCLQEATSDQGEINVSQAKGLSDETAKDRLSLNEDEILNKSENIDPLTQVVGGNINDSKADKKDISETAEENVSNEPMDILGNGLLTKSIVKKGDGVLTRPLQGQKVTLKTEGLLPDGTVIDKNESISFILGDGDVISGWDIAVALMELNEVAELKCDAKYAYGSQGRFPDVPSNTAIVYTLELLDKEPGPNYSFIPLDERLLHASVKKERGNYLFARNDFHGAINSYIKAISIIDQEDNSDITGKSNQIPGEKIKCFNNLAAAQIKIERYSEAIKSCEEVLKHDINNVKALFRMGRAYAAQGETKEAIAQMKKALKLEPETKDLNMTKRKKRIIHQELSKLTKKLSKETQSERNMCKKMFRTDKPPSKPSSDYSSWKWSIIAGSLVVVLLSLGVAYFR
ncbi:peptidyl-prolyl cis-trans isomerase FKBP8 isoform X1 [Octopus bimaculoides]|uniref:peptidylprolyl isomerase n=1 Tax=Octopus bimaculoides TaxID=37653 RepID=A0A0L8HHV3_OCTBM|nr:peptidyl-prolyl cis-trans isomerase FKBP8 isoform X1 [Octopus bimaculoides]XP_014772495.1 peptidyl-prolyl cis-trans isomerase FKBP8 isoform X1 [Octopus bimaculoides]XP_014772496.1 peptidyl-prolyl cis-trans isomerase FKBP8 isoform X1 [Octopus bimaculoides]XP_014772497.1 peptidyl-prolyl cis-trans isomerase FKBP8 isoform X1 [Octopus bimaculoides]|eukprot:XP_014772494.1 PREDICTED: peptidyl-prolyl cis-trans isomerase FKBP8-like isoform X1 [Octopus bimaculoides]